ncbi:TetR family transcriptional regulator [Amnibacterium setariae]|uniref:TetR family transcriptional regulator n=1 Tax=Amnibacterium setariae TaxID=2306585 RepID=A0A3A1TWK6_9MICO|nr:TetR family transcriptional regulator [Amnibacterium setariae]RIX28623.1 TetR family transcriptional regulator [Amnibacterium setariae]
MAGDAAATRASILRAAIAEFSEFGYRGGRIERVSAMSGANKRMIYVHFGDKEGLFSAALHAVLSRLTAEVPITEDDLPGYAVRLFDHLESHPEAARLSAWRQLERPDLGPDNDDLYRGKFGALSPGSPGPQDEALVVDALVLLQGMAAARQISGAEALHALAAGRPAAEDRARYRHSLGIAARSVVERLLGS